MVTQIYGSRDAFLVCSKSLESNRYINRFRFIFTLMHKLFLTSFTQVALVAMNVNFIANGYIIPMLVTGFGISFVWTLNVKKIAFGTIKDRLIYSLGAMVGTGAGYYLSNYLTTIL